MFIAGWSWSGSHRRRKECLRPIRCCAREDDVGRRTFFATCARGLGSVLAKELEEDVPWGTTKAEILDVVASGVRFAGNSLEVGCRAAFWLRTAMRVVEEVAIGENALDDVYGFIREAVPWGSEIVLPGQTFSVEVRTSAREGAVSNGVRARVKDAICDALRDRPNGVKPVPPRSASVADVPLFVTVNDGAITLYRDLAGGSLHKRGYREGTIHKR